MANDPQDNKNDKARNNNNSNGTPEKPPAETSSKGDKKRADGKVVFKSRYPKLTLYVQSPKRAPNGTLAEPGYRIRFNGGTAIVSAREAEGMRRLESFGRLFDEVKTGDDTTTTAA